MEDIKGLKFRSFLAFSGLILVVVSAIIYIVYMRIDAQISEMPILAENAALKTEISKYAEKLKKASPVLATAPVEETVPDRSAEERGAFNQELAKMENRVASLRQHIERMNNASVKYLVNKAITRAEDPRVKAVLDKASKEIDMAAEGKTMKLLDSSGDPLIGNVLSFNKKDNLVVIDMGSKDGLTEKDKCVILKGDKEIAYAEIISVRYDLSAAMITDIAAGYSVKDLESGCQVSVISAE
jgi:regulator of replication initiation timing